jgi:hypothetical protein
VRKIGRLLEGQKLVEAAKHRTTRVAYVCMNTTDAFLLMAILGDKKKMRILALS